MRHRYRLRAEVGLCGALGNSREQRTVQLDSSRAEAGAIS